MVKQTEKNEWKYNYNDTKLQRKFTILNNTKAGFQLIRQQGTS